MLFVFVPLDVYLSFHFWDGVTAEHIRYSGRDTIILMTMIFNSMTSQVFVPDHFKKGIRIPLYKGGGKKREVRESHRGITLLPFFK